MALLKDNVVSAPQIDYSFLNLAWNGRVHDFYKDTVYQKYNSFLSSFFEYFMSKDYVPNTYIKHVEQNPTCYTVKVKNTVSAAAGEPCVIQLHADSMFLNGKYSLPQVGFMLQLPPKGKNVIVIAVGRTQNGHTVTVVPSDETYAVSVTANDTLVVTPVVIKASCDTTQYDSVKKLPGIVYSSTLQTIGRNHKICGEELASFTNEMMLYSELDENGNKVDIWWHRDLDTMYDEFEMGKHRWLMNGEAITNQNANLTGKRGMTGFLWALAARAGYHGYGGDFDKTDMRSITNKMMADKIYCRDWSFWVGNLLRQNLDDTLDTVSSGKISWGCFGGDEEKWVNFGFRGWALDGFNFFLHTEDAFTDPCYLGAAGFNWPNNGVLVPMDKVNVPGKSAPVTRVVMNYLSANGYSRELMMRDYGALRPSDYDNKEDAHFWEVGSTLGSELYYGNHFYLVEKL